MVISFERSRAETAQGLAISIAVVVTSRDDIDISTEVRTQAHTGQALAENDLHTRHTRQQARDR